MYFIFGWFGPSLLHAGFLELRCVGFSLRCLPLSGSADSTRASAVTARGLVVAGPSQARHSTRVPWGGILTTGPPWKSQDEVFILFFFLIKNWNTKFPFWHPNLLLGCCFPANQPVQKCHFPSHRHLRESPSLIAFVQLPQAHRDSGPR